MFTVGQKINAKQNWTVSAAQIDNHMEYSDLVVESYWLEGKRGSQAILVRQMSKTTGKASQWTLIRGMKSETVQVSQ